MSYVSSINLKINEQEQNEIMEKMANDVEEIELLNQQQYVIFNDIIKLTSIMNNK